MSTRRIPDRLSLAEIQEAYKGPDGERYPPILSPKQLANLLGISRSTVYEWISRGYLDNAYRRRGKHTLIWRDRAIQILFNAPEWSNCESI